MSTGDARQTIPCFGLSPSSSSSPKPRRGPTGDVPREAARGGLQGEEERDALNNYPANAGEWFQKELGVVLSALSRFTQRP